MAMKQKSQLGRLPNDMVVEILEQLPVKSLLRFKSVSKCWYDLTNDPIFINSQLMQAKKHRTPLLLICRLPLPNQYEEEENDDIPVLSFHDFDSLRLDEVHPNMSIPRSEINGRVRVSEYKPFSCLGGSWSNGIICIMNIDCITLCNPALKQFEYVPYYRIEHIRLLGFHDEVSLQGFGVTCNGEFKVIIAHHYVRDLYEYVVSSYVPPTLFLVHLYSSSTKSWKQIDNDYIGPLSCNHGEQLFFNGACHWRAIENGILSFDLATETFHRLELPNRYESGDLEQLVVVNGCLAIVRTFGLGDNVEIWVMKEYGITESWTKQYCMMRLPDLVISKILYCENDRLLVETHQPRPYHRGQRIRTNQLTCLHFLTNEISKYQHRGLDMTALSYQESLVSLK